jgi:hypothetical protein
MYSIISGYFNIKSFHFVIFLISVLLSISISSRIVFVTTKLLFSTLNNGQIYPYFIKPHPIKPYFPNDNNYSIPKDKKIYE